MIIQMDSVNIQWFSLCDKSEPIESKSTAEDRNYMSDADLMFSPFIHGS